MHFVFYINEDPCCEKLFGFWLSLFQKSKRVALIFLCKSFRKITSSVKTRINWSHFNVGDLNVFYKIHCTPMIIVL